MAESWIKMRTELTVDHRVILMADTLRATPDFQEWCCGQKCDNGVTQRASIYVVVAGLLKVWGMARSQGKIVGTDWKDVLLSPSSLSAIDVASGLPGFGAVLERMGWAEAVEGPSVRFPDCVRHIYSKDEVERMKAAKRQADRRRDVTEMSQGASRECHTDVRHTITHTHTEQNGYLKRHPHSTTSARPNGNGDGVLVMQWGKERDALDLLDDSKIDELFGAVVACGFAHDTNEDRQRFAALVFNLRRQKAKKPFGLLTRIIEGRAKSKFDKPGADWRARATEADHDRARRALKQLDGIDGAEDGGEAS